ncbi:hypothetical protein TIFTF001_012568 [Ficus carica]|uniref:Uncharacterized protein n=1 Tax=Ficus carica TaxID=3494 RepID=A0AA88AG62_FICCA|nr:hypothetical protein TIFTF001_012568 [Ficus carica]
MRLLCNISPPLSQFPNPQSPPFFPNFTRKALIGALSFTLLISSPSPSPSLSFHPPSSPQSPPSEICREQVSDDGADSASDSAFTNEGIVEEAWEIVNESFLDSGRRRWSPETWQRKKEDIRSTSIQTRSKAHDIIKRMLASLGDPYTRFLSPEEVN